MDIKCMKCLKAHVYSLQIMGTEMYGGIKGGDGDNIWDRNGV